MNVTITLAAYHHNAERLAAAARAATRKNLLKMGAYVRTRARGLLRRKKTAAPAGSPPAVHSREAYANLRNIRFALIGDDSLIVGPEIWPQQTNQGLPAPAAQEHGGRVMLRKRTDAGTTAGGRRRRARNAAQAARYYVHTPANFPRRQFMLPALRHEAQKFPGLFKDAINP